MNFANFITIREFAVYIKLKIIVFDILFLENKHVFKNIQISLPMHCHVVSTYKLLKTIIPSL